MKIITQSIAINNKGYDWPKNIPLPRIGERVFIENESGTVNRVAYHFNGNSCNIFIQTEP